MKWKHKLWTDIIYKYSGNQSEINFIIKTFPELEGKFEYDILLKFFTRIQCSKFGKSQNSKSNERKPFMIDNFEFSPKFIFISDLEHSCPIYKYNVGVFQVNNGGTISKGISVSFRFSESENLIYDVKNFM